jgi:hypothetical protein
VCLSSRAPAPAPQPVIQPAKDEPAPILKLKKDDGTEEVVKSDEVKQDTGTSSVGGTTTGTDPLAIPTPKQKKNKDPLSGSLAA